MRQGDAAMSRFRSIARQSPAIVISLLALTFSLGSGAGYAASVATSHPASPTKIIWHVLKLRNGWHTFSSALGAPSYAIRNGVVYLAGGAARSGSGLPVLAVLPAGARPKHFLELGAFSSAANTPAALFIASNGDITPSGANASYQTSLAGISFPVGE
jgi:hypothetical protein